MNNNNNNNNNNKIFILLIMFLISLSFANALGEAECVIEGNDCVIKVEIEDYTKITNSDFKLKFMSEDYVGETKEPIQLKPITPEISCQSDDVQIRLSNRPSLFQHTYYDADVKKTARMYEIPESLKKDALKITIQTELETTIQRDINDNKSIAWARSDILFLKDKYKKNSIDVCENSKCKDDDDNYAMIDYGNVCEINGKNRQYGPAVLLDKFDNKEMTKLSTTLNGTSVVRESKFSHPQVDKFFGLNKFDNKILITHESIKSHNTDASVDFGDIKVYAYKTIGNRIKDIDFEIGDIKSNVNFDSILGINYETNSRVGIVDDIAPQIKKYCANNNVNNKCSFDLVLKGSDNGDDDFGKIILFNSFKEANVVLTSTQKPSDLITSQVILKLHDKTSTFIFGTFIVILSIGIAYGIYMFKKYKK